MKLLTPELMASLPPLYSQEKASDPAGDPACRESRALPGTDPGAFQRLQGESGAIPA